MPSFNSCGENIFTSPRYTTQDVYLVLLFDSGSSTSVCRMSQALAFVVGLVGSVGVAAVLTRLGVVAVMHLEAVEQHAGHACARLFKPLHGLRDFPGARIPITRNQE